MTFDPQTQTVLDALARVGDVPVASLRPGEARLGPTVADAVRAVLWQEGTSLSPEPVGAVEDMTIPAPHGSVPVRMYWPLGADTGPLPVLIYAHGGGWVLGDLDDYDATPRALANRAGCIVVSVAYRLAPEHRFPAAHDDVLAATTWTQANIIQLSGDPGRVAVGGEGAGATMAIATSRALKASGAAPPLFQLLAYPITDLDRTDWASYRAGPSTAPLSAEAIGWFAGHVVADPRDLDDPRLSPARCVRSELAGLPPSLVITAEHDPLRDQGEAFGRLLLDSGVTATTLRFGGVTHDFMTMNPVVDQAQRAVSAAAKHLREAFKLKGESAPTVVPDLAQVLAADHAGLTTLLNRLEWDRGDRRRDSEQLRQSVAVHIATVQAVHHGAGAGITVADFDALLGPLDPGEVDARFQAALHSLRAAIEDERVSQERELAEMRAAFGNKAMVQFGRKALEARRAGAGRRSQGSMARAG